MAKQTGNEKRLDPDIKKKSTNSRKVVSVPGRFQPRFWTDADQRIATVRAIKKRYEILKEHTQADSIQRDLLCQRAAFLACIVEKFEVECAEGEGLDLGVYTQAVNSLQGLLKTLGLTRQIKNVTDLKSYLEDKKR